MEELRELLTELLLPHSRRQSRIEFNQRVILQAMEILLVRDKDMAKIHDDLTAALAANSAALAANNDQITALAAAKDESDAAFVDILATVTDQGKTLATQSEALAKALASAAAPVVDPVTVTTTVATPTTAPTMSVPLASTVGITAGDSVAGPGVEAGTTVTSVDHTTSTVTLSDPTTADHTGSGTETVTVTPAAPAPVAAS